MCICVWERVRVCVCACVCTSEGVSLWPMTSTTALSAFDLYSCSAVLGLLQSQSPCSVAAYGLCMGSGLWLLPIRSTVSLSPNCVCVPACVHTCVCVCHCVCVCLCIQRDMLDRISMSSASSCSLLISCVSGVMDRWKRVRCVVGNTNKYRYMSGDP